MSGQDLLKYEVDLPRISDKSDVETQILQVLIGGVEYSSAQLSKTAATATFIVPQGSKFQLRLGYRDDSAHTSTSFGPPTAEIEAIDTIPPEAPAPFGAIRLVGEIEGGVSGDEEPIAEEPVVEEPVVEEPVVEEPIADEPIAEEPIAEEPVVEEPVVEEPVVEEVPAADEAPGEDPTRWNADEDNQSRYSDEDLSS